MKKTLEKILNVQEVQAHCDIPCGIYDPSKAIVSALTVIRMTDLLDAHKEVKQSVDYLNEVSRYIGEKERHAEEVKHEIRVIWGDFIKPAHIEKYPELHELTHSIMMAASQAKQTVSKEASLDLLEKVNKFAEIFWAIKGVETKRVVAPYAPAKEVVYPAI